MWPLIWILRLGLSWPWGFGGADGDVEAVFAEGLFVASVFGEQFVAEADDTVKDGAFGLGVLTGGDADEGGGFVVEGGGLGFEFGGFLALCFCEGGVGLQFGDFGGVQFRFCTQLGMVGNDALGEGEHLVRASDWKFDFKCFACHNSEVLMTGVSLVVLLVEEVTFYSGYKLLFFFLSLSLIISQKSKKVCGGSKIEALRAMGFAIVD